MDGWMCEHTTDGTELSSGPTYDDDHILIDLSLGKGTTYTLHTYCYAVRRRTTIMAHERLYLYQSDLSMYRTGIDSLLHHSFTHPYTHSSMPSTPINPNILP